jgi:arabinose-5-phosphate isomerase
MSQAMKKPLPAEADPHAKAAADAGRRVLQAEIEGLKALQDAVNGDFSTAVAVINSMKQTRHGRLIVAGIGKSGHIARKIAATLASTGTPSYFVHPGEASHGDLGMVTEHDVVLLLSNSGENAELSDLIHYTRRFAIPLIAMTSKPDSALAQHADIKLILPRMPEACPNGMAPTTSTTMMLALGDALAVALLERMGLTKEQFRVFHPGGKLGQQLLRVGDIMHKGAALPVIGPDAQMDAAILVLSEKNLGVVLIVDAAGDLQGIVTDGDLKRHMSADLLQKPVTAVMTRDPKTIGADQLAAEAMNMMTRTPGRYLTSLVAVDDGGRLAGLIRLQDCLQAGIA